MNVFRILSFLSILNIHFLFSQNADNEIVFVGKLNRYDTIPPQKIENAKLRVWYEFSHPVKYEKEEIIRKDTMALVAGDNYSMYYDWFRESKYKNLISQLDGAKKTTKEIIYNSFHIFSDIAVDQKRLSEFTLNRENAQILKNRTANLIITTDLDDSDIVSEKLYWLDEKISPQQWQFMEEEETEILGYLCQKAVCRFQGRNYTAWFTLDIPINDGPYKFYGLPGLILKIEDSEKLFQFTAIGLEQLQMAENQERC